MHHKKLSFALLLALIVPAVHAEAVIHQRNRTHRVSAETTQGGDRFQFDFPFSVETYDEVIAVFFESYGGSQPGLTFARATTTQHSTISSSLFSGSLTATADAFATQDFKPRWIYNAYTDATTDFFVQFELLTPHNFSLTGIGLGDTSFFLRDAGGSYLFSDSDFGVLNESGQLAAGLYDFGFATYAGATAYGIEPVGQAQSVTASGDFAFSLFDVPDAGSTLMLLSLTAPLLLLRRRRSRS